VSQDARQRLHVMKPNLAQFRTRLTSLLPARSKGVKAVTFFVTRGHEYTVNVYLMHHGGCVANQVNVIAYEGIDDVRRIGRSQIYVFTDLERLDRDSLARATQLWDALGALDPIGIRLNHPTRALRRYELLRLLDARGLNSFRVYRLNEYRTPRTFPVFIRREDDHPHVAPPLIHDQSALTAAIDQIVASGTYRDNLLIVEFCDVSDGQGHYRRFSSFNVNGEIIHRHLAVADSWFCKGKSPINTEETRREEMAFITSDRYKDQVLEIFHLARLDYGRIDYAIIDGRIVTWEINTAPAIMNALGPNILHDVVTAFSAQFNTAFARLAQLPCA
jgi:hypothetical protein